MHRKPKVRRPKGIGESGYASYLGPPSPLVTSSSYPSPSESESKITSKGIDEGCAEDNEGTGVQSTGYAFR